MKKITVIVFLVLSLAVLALAGDTDQVLPNGIKVPGNKTQNWHFQYNDNWSLIDGRIGTYDSHIESTANPHSTAITNIGSGKLSELNAALSDATLIDTTDSRLSDARAPRTHTHTESEILNLGDYEPAFTKNTAFNKDFGTTTGTITEGSHAGDSSIHFLQSEIAIQVSQISDIGSNYYTQGQIESLLSGKADNTHNHSLASLSERSAASLNTGVLDIARLPTGGTWTATSQLKIYGNQNNLADYEPLVLLSSEGMANISKGALLHLYTTRGGGTGLTPLFKIESSTGGVFFDIRNSGASNFLFPVSIGPEFSSEDEFQITANTPYMRMKDTKDGNWAEGDSFGGIRWESSDNNGGLNAAIEARHLRAGTGHANADAGLVFLTSNGVNPGTIEAARLDSYQNFYIKGDTIGIGSSKNLASSSATGSQGNISWGTGGKLFLHDGTQWYMFQGVSF